MATVRYNFRIYNSEEADMGWQYKYKKDKRITYKVHLTKEGRLKCGSGNIKEPIITNDPNKVTCEKCRSTEWAKNNRIPPRSEWYE